MSQPPENQQQYGSILTILGENAEQNGKLKNKQITFTHIAIGDANDTYVQPDRKQTALVNELARIPVNSVDVLQPTPDSTPMLKVEAILPDDVNDLIIREFAAVATFDGNTYFHAVGNCARIYVPAPVNNGNVSTPVTLEMIFVITSAEPIIEIDPNVVIASRDWVNKKVETRTETVGAFTDIPKKDINATHIITRGYNHPGDKGNAEFTHTGQIKQEEAGQTYLNIGLVYDQLGREFEIISSPLNYRQFGAVLDGQSPVMRQIKDCHDCANLKKLPVVNEDGIALIDDSYLAVINTNVDWGMTEFVIHEDVGRPATWDFPVLFRAEGNPLSDFNGALNHTEFYETSSHVASLSSLHNAYVFIESDLEHIKRKPESTTFIYKKEPNRVVKNGELNKPLRFDYSGATSLSVKYRNLEESYITIKGGFIDLNRSPSHVFLDIARNNTIWELIGFKDKTQSDELNIRATMKITHAADIRLINVNGEAPTRLEGTEGTYGLSGNGIVDLQMENINGYCGWGFSGFNNINGLSLKGSKINRIDCHFGLWDFYAEDTHFKEWGVMVGNGGGYLKLKNCSRFFGKSTKLNASQYGYKSVVQFRPDYGAEWRGNIDIDGLTLIIDSNMPVTDIIKIVDFVSNGDYGAKQITEWGRNINVQNVVINAPDSHLNRHEFGVVCVDYNKKAITTGVRLPARIVVDNVNYSKENAKAYISAVNGPNDKYVKMPVESESVLSGAHNSVWCISRIFNANRNPFHDDGIPGAETLIQYDPIPDDRNINSDRIKLRAIVTDCTMFDVEVTVDHLIEVHGGSCISYDANSGGLVSEGEAWFYGSQIIPLPSRTSGNAEFSLHHLRDCTIVKTATQYIPTNCLSSKGTLVEKGAAYDWVSPADLFHGYVKANARYESVDSV